MILHILRALFVLLMAAVGFFFAFQESPPLDLDISVIIAITLSVLLVCLDILSPPRRKLAIFSGLQDFREHLGGTLSVTLLSGVGASLEVSELDESVVAAAIAWLRDRGGASSTSPS